jgi:hypothetical protein
VLASTVPTADGPPHADSRVHCQAKLDPPAEYKGRFVKCSMCGKSFVLRFTAHDMPFVAVRFTGRESEPAPELKSTVSFRLPDSPPAEPTVRAPERADPEAPVPEKATPREVIDGR